jgi:hypothetical protein
MELPQGVQRVWRLTTRRQDCVGAIVEGHVDGLTPVGTVGVVALVSFAEHGELTKRQGPNGKMFYVAQFTSDKSRQIGHECQSVGEALASLEEKKAELLAAGWREVSVDSDEDPD